jgi:hypothetical protein
MRRYLPPHHVARGILEALDGDVGAGRVGEDIRILGNCETASRGENGEVLTRVQMLQLSETTWTSARSCDLKANLTAPQWHWPV